MKVQQNAYQHLSRPGLDADIVDYVWRCQECVCWAHPPKEPLQAHDVPQQSWECIAMDHFYVNGRLYVLVCDYFSKFPFVFQTRTISFANLRDYLQELFVIEGTPDEIKSDNGPPFNGKEFNAFLTGLGIRHTTSSPNYPESNGLRDRSRQWKGLPSLRAQPLGDGLNSLAEVLHERSLVTRKATPVDIVAIRQFLIVCRPSTPRTLTRPGGQRPSDHWRLVKKSISFQQRMNGKLAQLQGPQTLGEAMTSWQARVNH